MDKRNANKAQQNSGVTPKDNFETKNIRNKSSISFSDEQQTGYGIETAPSAAKLNIPKKTINHFNNNSSGSSGPPKSTIMSLPDRDLIVIDKKDINESTKNDEVIIVDAKTNRGGLDLVDVLKCGGKNWPAIAGAIGDVINSSDKISYSQAVNSTSSNNYNTRERNKSSNILSHISASTIDKNKEPVGIRKSK